MSTNTIKVKPREGVSVRRIENGEKIPTGGATVPNNSYYHRRIKDGDLIDTAAKTTKPVAKPAAKKGAK